LNKGLQVQAAVLLPISPEENEKIANVVCRVLTDNLEAEVCGKALGMDMARQYYTTYSQLLLNTTIYTYYPTVYQQ